MKNILTDKTTIIAVIGYGRFAQLLVDILSQHSKAKIIVISRKRITQTKRVNRESIQKIKDADIVIPCVPIASFETVIKQIAPLLKEDAIVIDVCSVKMIPVEIMKDILPKHVQIIASHPMFGPDSYRIKKSLKGMKLAIWNVSAKKVNYEQIKSFFKSLGLTITELSPKDHDKLMAYSLGYSYLIGKIGQHVGIKKTKIDTYDFDMLLEHTAIVQSDSEQLFIDMQTKNPFAKEVRKKLDDAYKKIKNNINQQAL